MGCGDGGVFGFFHLLNGENRVECNGSMVWTSENLYKLNVSGGKPVEFIYVGAWKKLLNEHCEECRRCRYLKVYEEGELVFEDGRLCSCWKREPSIEEWETLIDDIHQQAIAASER